jgi:hypothetical protein
MRRDEKTALLGLGLAVGVVGLLACTPSPKIWACATTDDPPIVAADSNCPNAHEDDPPEGSRYRWYSAPQYDIGHDDMPVIGEPLDGDFYDLRDQLDMDESTKKTTAKSTTKKTTTTKTTKKVAA